MGQITHRRDFILESPIVSVLPEIETSFTPVKFPSTVAAEVQGTLRANRTEGGDMKPPVFKFLLESVVKYLARSCTDVQAVAED